jgi:hypothetical protein
MDEAGRGSIGPAVGPGRRKDKCNYPGPQAEAEDNVDHRACQRSTGYEEMQVELIATQTQKKEHQAQMEPL